jgi:hypothetical protein
VTPFRIVHEFATGKERYWKVFFHEPYNVALYERIKVKERKVLHWKETDGTIERSIKILPARDLPGFLKKIVGGDLGYVESSTFYKDKDSIDVTVEPTLMKDRTTMKARYWIELPDASTVRRIFEGSIHVDMPFVGRKIEQFIVDDMKRGYDTAAQVTKEWLGKADLA